MEAIGCLEGGQRRWTLDELSRGSEAEPAAGLEVRREVAGARMRRKPLQILADRDDPSVVGGGRNEPDQAVLRLVERRNLGVAFGRVLPDGVSLAMEEQRTVAGVFGIDVDLPGKDRGPHDIGRAEPDAALDGKSLRLDRR